MKVRIEATQDEFDRKRPELLKALAANKFEIIKAQKDGDTVYDKEKPAIEMRRAYFTAQNQIMDHFDAKFKKFFDQLKLDIEKVIDSK